jgi:hypothetical protein
MNRCLTGGRVVDAGVLLVPVVPEPVELPAVLVGGAGVVVVIVIVPPEPPPTVRTRR